MRTLFSVAVMMVVCLAPGALAQPPGAAESAAPPPGGRGRDPWVFRCIFEDRTRMVILATAPGVWIAFNPATGSVQKAWKGEMVFRGKVWDFSQDNSIAKGEVLLDRRSELVRLPDSGAELARWSVRSAAFDGDWRFVGPESTIQSPVFDARGFERLFVAFDEMSRKGPIRVDVSTDGGERWDAQWFNSTTHGSRDDEWQWNFKQISPDPTERMRVQFRQTDGAFAKRMRNARVFGDEIAWAIGPSGEPGSAAKVVWRGYELINQTEGVRLQFDVGDGTGAASVTLRIEAKTHERRTEGVERANDRFQAHWQQVVPAHVEFRETYEVAGVPAGQELTLRLPAMPAGGQRGCWAEGVFRRDEHGDRLVISRDGTYEVVTKINTKEEAK